jgi:hypothetical protein
MVQETRVPARRVARAMAWLGPIGLVLGLAGACSQLRGSLGADCLKDEDCLSGFCAQLHCVAAPPLLDAEPEPTGGDAGADAAAPGDGTAPVTDAMEAGEGSATSPDAPAPDSTAEVPDATTDATNQGLPDSSGEDSSDVPVDARADGGDAG